MPKIKSKKAARKRFKVTKSGKIMRGQANQRHMLEWESNSKKRGRRGLVQVSKSDLARVQVLLGE